MKNFVNKSKKFILKTNNFIPIMLLCLIIIIAINPAKYSKVSLQGLEIWFKVLVPALLPFFIITKLFAKTNFLTDITSMFSRPTKLLYSCPPISSYIFFMSIITGYPVGAKLVSDCYKNGEISKTQAIRTLSYSSNSGPMFILGSVAIGMFANKTLGIVIYISHVVGSLLNGLIYRTYKCIDDNILNQAHLKNLNTKQNKESFSESINSSINSILLIGGVICFTFVVIEAISSSSIFIFIINLLSKLGINKSISTAMLSGIFEITKGCLVLSNATLSFDSISLFATFIISFGGISTLLQATAFTQKIIPTKLFLLQKITHALCATFVCFIILLII